MEENFADKIVLEEEINDNEDHNTGVPLIQKNIINNFLKDHVDGMLFSPGFKLSYNKAITMFLLNMQQHISLMKETSKKKTVMPDDVIQALRSMGLPDIAEELLQNPVQMKPKPQKKNSDGRLKQTPTLIEDENQRQESRIIEEQQQIIEEHPIDFNEQQIE